MALKNQRANRRHSGSPDVVKEFTDSAGRRILLKAEFKSFNGRPGVAAISVQTSDQQVPLTRRMLSEIPLDKIFRNELMAEANQLADVLRSRRRKTAHQGRKHTDDELRVVADIYVAAFKARLPVQKAVADALGISVSTAAKRIMATRQRGLIS